MARDVTVWLRGKDTLSKTLKNAQRNVGNFREELKNDDGIKAFVRNLDTADSRMSNLAQTAMALGPALVPIGAAAVPAIAGLTAGLGAAAGAAGVAALAFNGVGDGLSALNDYQLEPTAANLDKVRQAFQDLGPAGANFVLFLDDLQPKLDQLQNTARAGLLPGVEAGIRSLMDRAPQVNRIIGNISTALGDLAAEGGEALSSEKFDDFFDYIEREARPILMDMGRTLGNFTEGLSNMLVGFDPLTRDFSSGLLGMSRDFAEWSRQLESNQGFQEFVDYVQRVGPKAIDALGSVAVAFADIVEAAAPVGEATLPVIQAVAETFSAIASSPVGPVLITAAAGISAISRAVAVGKASNITALSRGLKTARKEGTRVGRMADRLAGQLSGKGALAGSVGLLALQFTDLDEKSGFANTAMGAMMGSVAGPWGAAIGGGIGLVKDFVSVNDNLEDSLKDVNQALGNVSAFKAQESALADYRSQIQKSKNDLADFGDSDFWTQNPLDAIRDIDNVWNSAVNWITNDIEEAEKKFIDAAEASSRFRYTVGRLAQVAQGKSIRHMATDAGTLEKQFSNMEPALRAAGIEIDNLRVNGPNWDEAVRAVRNYNRANDSVPGRVKGVRKALNSLDDPLLTAEEAASALDDALSKLFDPQLNAREALIEWKGGLVDLRAQIRGTNGSLNLNTKAGRENQSMIIEQVRKLQNVAVTQSRVDGNTKRATKTLRNGRDELIKAGVESGISADKMKRLVNQMGLVPNVVAPKVNVKGTGKAKGDFKNVDKWARKVIDRVNIFADVPGANKTKDDLEGIKNRQDKVNRRLNIHSSTTGVPGTKSDLDSVDRAERGIANRHDVDMAAPRADKVFRQLSDVDQAERGIANRHKVHTSAPGATKAKKDLNFVEQAIRDIAGKTVGINLSSNARSIVQQAKSAVANFFNADGNILEYYSQGDVRNGHTAQIAPAGAWRVWAEPETGGEAYIPLAQSKRKRSLDIWQETGRRLGVQGFADGDVVSAKTGRSKLQQRHPQAIDAAYVRFAKGLGDEVSSKLSKALEQLNVGFHWPLPREFGYSGSWGSYPSGGSHPALDFPAPRGTPIYSVLPGTVMHTTSLGDSYGNYTEVSHGRGLSSLYAHQRNFNTEAGAKVMAGETIGFVNSTGNSTGDHLHLEMQRGGRSFDYTAQLNSGMSFRSPQQYEGSHEGLNRAGPSTAKAYAQSIMGRYGWGAFQWPYWLDLGNRESGWRWNATNPSSGAYGIPQSLPPEKMASAGSDWRTNVGTQLDWMAQYIAGRYGGPYGAIQWHNANNWYGSGGIRGGSGINVFDNGGVWPSGTLGVNLSGRDEYVNNPQTTAAAVQMANGGVLGSTGRWRRRDVNTFRVVPGALRSFADMMRIVSRPENVNNIRDLNKAWRRMRREIRQLDREERQLRNTRKRSRRQTRAVNQTEKNLEQRRTELDKSRRKIERTRDRLRSARQGRGDNEDRIDKLEKRLKLAQREKDVDKRQVKNTRQRLRNRRQRERRGERALKRQERVFERQKRRRERFTDRWRTMQSELHEAAEQVAESITSAGDVFGGEGTSVTAQGLLAKLTDARQDAGSYRRLLKRVKARGINSTVLDQIIGQGQTPESLAILRSLATAPSSLIRSINRQQNRLEKIADRTGTWTVSPQRQRRTSVSPPRGGGHQDAGRGRTIQNNFNGPIYTTDPKAAAREIERKQHMGLLVAQGA